MKKLLVLFVLLHVSAYAINNTPRPSHSNDSYVEVDQDDMGLRFLFRLPEAELISELHTCIIRRDSLVETSSAER